MASVLDEAIAIAEVRRGKLFFRNRRLFDQQVANLKDGWIVEVTVKRLRANRSLQQSRYYWGVIVQAIEEYTGYTPEEVHEFLKAKFIPKQLSIANGNGEIVGEYVLGGSTRSMTTVEFEGYLTSIKQWAAAELDLYIPDPNEAL